MGLTMYLLCLMGNGHPGTDHFDLESAALKLSANTDSFGNIQFGLAQAIDGFELQGAGDCDAVIFTATEGFRGDEIVHEFTGESKSNGDISGTFTAAFRDQPSCQSTGNFRMIRR